MRNYAVLQSAVIGLTAFLSMLARKAGADQKRQKTDLELRSRLSQLYKITYDQFILAMSYAIGRFGGFEQSVQSPKTWENKLFNSYTEHIHLLFINKKIQCEDDYLIFNSKLLHPVPQSAYISNEDNRDY